ncbi:hypothetical protein [Xanthomonas arboricola]|uniref:hypothetical protein n=1 Tax=Xanthomonas arboricola TaxID=56448 RepID=UPI0015C754ED
MHALLISAAAALLGVVLSAAAGEPSQFGHAAQLYQETSATGETLDAFVNRIAPRARAHSSPLPLGGGLHVSNLARSSCAIR